ncbi:hypothetical protein J437_LFUL013551 [Ladona fulva]|uniref:Uncharacterized protein n=1 Tax=Ladona fulva TaxID=123851 RepID=A0A8K0KH05_LADFU|nr:hypothetical protein J437_LFUL013551 [Ladona fulva]
MITEQRSRGFILRETLLAGGGNTLITLTPLKTLSLDLTRMMIELLNLQHQQNAEQCQQIEKLIGETISASISSSSATIPIFMPFDPLSELWKDYWAQSQMFHMLIP